MAVLLLSTVEMTLCKKILCSCINSISSSYDYFSPLCTKMTMFRPLQLVVLFLVRVFPQFTGGQVLSLCHYCCTTKIHTQWTLPQPLQYYMTLQIQHSSSPPRTCDSSVACRKGDNVPNAASLNPTSTWPLYQESWMSSGMSTSSETDGMMLNFVKSWSPFHLSQIDQSVTIFRLHVDNFTPMLIKDRFWSSARQKAISCRILDKRNEAQLA